MFKKIRKHIKGKKIIRQWEAIGKPLPPPDVVKHRTVKSFASRYSLTTLIETGTYWGDMVYATKDIFHRIYSIEIDEDLFRAAKKRFKKYSHISIIHGDSSLKLPELLGSITKPCLFWLDGHYSGGVTGKGGTNTPIMEELHHILNRGVQGDTILIDDARLFNGEDDYPTIEEVVEVFHSHSSSWQLSVEDDIMRLYE